MCWVFHTVSIYAYFTGGNWDGITWYGDKDVYDFIQEPYVYLYANPPPSGFYYDYLNLNFDAAGFGEEYVNFRKLWRDRQDYNGITHIDTSSYSAAEELLAGASLERSSSWVLTDCFTHDRVGMRSVYASARADDEDPVMRNEINNAVAK